MDGEDQSAPRRVQVVQVEQYTRRFDRARRDPGEEAGLRALLERDAAVERWLREEVVPGHQEYLRDPSKGIAAASSISATGSPHFR
jgi:hypothetical protein